MYTNLATLAIFLFIYCVIAGRVDKMPVSGPIIFVVFGLAFGPSGFGVLVFEITGEGFRTLAELTLAIVLFTDAAGSNLGVLKRSGLIPARLLVVGLASIVFIVIVLNYRLPANQDLSSAVVCTVLFSILAHGISANPLISLLGVGSGRAEGLPKTECGGA